MEFVLERRKLIAHVIEKGIGPDEFVASASKLKIKAPDDLILRWKKRYFSNKASVLEAFPEAPRLLNKFCVGADPEWTFAAKRYDEYAYTHAESFGLGTIQAFGSDMSGRQAEMRAEPSKFVLEVLASMCDTMRWMVYIHPNIAKTHWLSPAFFQVDGNGGHVHIGTKRPETDKVVSSMDAINLWLQKSGVLDEAGQAQRIRNTRYGRFGDFRPQPHGFEYRALPSWLGSPLTAYLALVLSKLSVLHTLSYSQRMETLNSRMCIENFLRAYKNRDDDAAIALFALKKHGLPKFTNTDFKGEWGLPIRQSEKRSPTRIFVPPSIPWHKDTVKELFDHLIKGTAIPNVIHAATWTPYELDDDASAVRYTAHQYGPPDIAQGLVSRENCTTNIDSAGRCVEIGGTWPFDHREIEKYINKENLDKIGKIAYAPMKPSNSNEKPYLFVRPPIGIANAQHIIDKEMVRQIRKLLCDSGLFPICRFVDYADYAPGKKKVDPKPAGSIIYQIDGSRDVGPATIYFNPGATAPYANPNVQFIQGPPEMGQPPMIQPRVAARPARARLEFPDLNNLLPNQPGHRVNVPEPPNIRLGGQAWNADELEPDDED